MEPLTSEFSKLSIEDSAHSMTQDEKDCLWTLLAGKKHCFLHLLNKYLDGGGLPRQQGAHKIHQSKVLHAFGKYLHCHFPPEMTLETLAQKAYTTGSGTDLRACVLET